MQPHVDPPSPPPGPEPRTRAAWTVVFLALVLAGTGLAYRLTYGQGLQRTAALYIGVPTVLAVGLALVPRSRSATGVLVRGSTLGLLLAGIVLPEGLICLVMVLPLVLMVSVLIGMAIDMSRARNKPQGPTLMAVTLPLALASLEGVVGTPFDPRDRAVATVEVAASPEQVATALASPPRFHTDLPAFLTFGFNRPVGATGSGLAVGDRRTIVFTGGTHDDHPVRLLAGSGERSTDHHAPMELTVTESGPGRVVFGVAHDGTMLARWTDLDRAVVTWAATGAGTTTVTWTLEYERLIYPSAYFAPIQRYGMDRAAGYLLDAVVREQLP